VQPAEASSNPEPVTIHHHLGEGIIIRDATDSNLDGVRASDGTSPKKEVKFQDPATQPSEGTPFLHTPRANPPTKVYNPEDDPNKIVIFHTAFYRDTVEKVVTVLLMIAELFKLFMASLLAVFVPQLCSPDELNASAWRVANGPSECTFEENFTMVTPYNIFVLVWNFTTLGICISHRAMTLRREAFLVDNFDVNHAMPASQIQDVLKQNLTLSEWLRTWNKRNHISATLFVSFNCLNFLFSAILVFLPSNNAGFRTFTVFFTNILLVSQVQFFDYFNSRNNLRKHLAVSLVNRDMRAYNCQDHRRALSQRSQKVIQVVDMHIDENQEITV